MYALTVVVLLSEVCKMLCCLVMIAIDAGGVVGAIGVLREALPTRDTWRLGVPALAYTIQNNILFVAISNLPAAVVQVVYQGKTLSTAAFSVLLLG